MAKRVVGRGVFIAFEGIDLCGKTTQLDLFAERLKDFSVDVFVTKEPGSPHSEIARQIRKILLSKKNTQIVPRAELALFFADRAQHIMESGLVGEKLQQGKVIVTDREWASTFAYQFYGRQMQGFEFIKKMNDFFCYGVYPDLNILIDIPVEMAQSRARSQKDLSRFDVEDKDFHQRVRDGFLKLIDKETEKWLVFDGSKSIKDLAEEIWQKVGMEWLKKFPFVKS